MKFTSEEKERLRNFLQFILLCFLGLNIALAIFGILISIGVLKW